MGELYLALSGAPGMEKLCVIKTVLPHLVAPDNAQRFRDEAMVVGAPAARQPGARLRRRPQRRSDLHLAMEYVEGKDLLAAWNRCAQRRVPFPIEVAAYIVKELARGLGYAHAFGGLEARPPRRLARERAALVHRRGQAHRLRPGDVDAKAAADGARDHLRQAGLPGARAGAERDARRAHRPLRGGHPAVGAAHRTAAVPRQAGGVRARPSQERLDGRRARARAQPARDPALARHRRVPPELDRIVMRALAGRARRSLPDGRGAARRSRRPTSRRPRPRRTRDAWRPSSLLFEKDTEDERREREELVRERQPCCRARRCRAAWRTRCRTARGARETPDRGSKPATPSRGVRPTPVPHRVPSGAHAEGDRRRARRSHPRLVEKDPRVGTTLAGRYSCGACAARAPWAASTRGSTSTSAGASPSRSCTRAIATRPSWSSASAARRAPRRGSATPTSSTSPTRARPPTARSSS